MDAGVLMLEVFRSNKLDVLAHLLVEQLAEQVKLGIAGGGPADGPFRPLRVVVGSRGMERWLRHRIADHDAFRIAANLEFPFPQQVLAEVLLALEGRGEAAPADPWSADVLPWIVLEVLPELLAAPDPAGALAPLRAYLGATSGGEGTAGPVGPRALELAFQIGDVLDRLVVFRPEIAVAWSQGRGGGLPRGAEDLAWQPRLWAAIQAHLMALELDPAHAADRWARLGTGDSAGCGPLRAPEPLPPPLDQPVRIFGVSSLPPSFLRNLARLPEACRVQIFTLCPSPIYWADLHRLGTASLRGLLTEDRDRLGERLAESTPLRPHPLLQSLGRVSRDLQIVLEDISGGTESGCAVFIDPAPILADPGPPMPVPALHALQSDLLHLRDPLAAEFAPRPLAPADDSIQLHACYGLTRQVEVLREALLHLFETHPGLEPRDVLVLSPDIEACLPLIDAVFGQGRDEPAGGGGSDGCAEPWGDPGAPRIPFAVSERSVRRTNPVAEVLLRVLELCAGQARVSSVAVLDLLAVEPFRRRFGIEQADLETLAGWVEDSGIRWGLDAADRGRAGQPAQAQNTWRFGLERLALGVAMADAPGRIWDPPGNGQPAPDRALGVAPFDGLEGGALHLLGRFFDAGATLFDEIGRLGGGAGEAEEGRGAGEGSRTLEAWVAASVRCVERLTATPGKARWLTARVLEELQELARSARAGHSRRAFTVRAFAALLAGRFEVASGATSARGGAVTFSALAPHRAVPRRVVCMLGMDEGAFPRNPERRRFDLTHLAPRVGDRDARDEDRHLLLETLLAAGDHLLVCYTGRDPRSNERRAPAVPIAELCAILDATFAPSDGRCASALLTREHPLQAFSPRCFVSGTDGRPWSYDRALLDGCRAALSRARTVPTFFAAGGSPVDAEGKEQPLVTTPAKPLVELTFEDVAWFLRNPTRSLLTRGLDLHLPQDEEPLPQREPIEPDALDRWNWSERLLADRWAALEARWEPGAPAPGVGSANRERLRAEGALPLGAGGQRWIAAPAALVDALLGRAAAWFGSEQDPLAPGFVPVDLELELPAHRVRLAGRIGPIWAGDQLCLGIGDIVGKGKYRLGPWVRHLAWLAAGAGPGARTVLLSGRLTATGEPEIQAASLALAAPEGADPGAVARAHLAALVALVVEGLERPVPLFEHASWAFVKRCFYYNKQRFAEGHLAAADLDPEVLGHLVAAWSHAARDFGGDDDGDGASGTDLDDPYVARAWCGLDPVTDPSAPLLPLDRHFARIAMTVWRPIFSGWRSEGRSCAIAPRDAGGAA